MTADFSRLTVVTVTGEEGPNGGDAAAPSLIHSAAQLPGSRALMISPERPATLPGHIEHHRIKPFGYVAYSLFMLYALDSFIETEFALVVQKDGWVLNATNWRDEFFDVDYIGAPSVTALTREASGAQMLYNHYTWQQQIGRDGVAIHPVYNGGFSLRSKRLLAAPRRLGLSMNIPPPLLGHADDRDQTRFEISWPWGQHAEDAQLCIYMREALAADGIRFSPLALALDFSFEYIGSIIHAGYDFAGAFGTHCKLRKFVGGTPPEIDCSGNEEDLAFVDRQSEVNAFLATHYGYKIRQ